VKASIVKASCRILWHGVTESFTWQQWSTHIIPRKLLLMEKLILRSSSLTILALAWWEATSEASCNNVNYANPSLATCCRTRANRMKLSHKGKRHLIHSSSRQIRVTLPCNSQTQEPAQQLWPWRSLCAEQLHPAGWSWTPVGACICYVGKGRAVPEMYETD